MKSTSTNSRDTTVRRSRETKHLFIMSRQFRWEWKELCMKYHELRKLRTLHLNNVMGVFFFARPRGIIEPKPPNGYHLECEEHSCRQKNSLPVVFATVSELQSGRLLGAVLYDTSRRFITPAFHNGPEDSCCDSSR